jgi:Zn-dependent membrane protease YugP
VWIGVVLFNAAFALQVLCLPLEWDACRRARRKLDELEQLDPQGTTRVVRVMNASVLRGLTVGLQPFTAAMYWIRG